MVRIKRTMPIGLFAMVLCAAACGDDDGAPARPDAGPEPDADVGAPDAGDDEPDAGPAMAAPARFVIEHDAADDATGFQIFFDGEPWTMLSVTGPNGEVLDVEALGPMANFGLTEMFMETNEPSNDETPRADVLALFPEGDYEFEVTSTGGDPRTFTATLSHAIPARAQIRTPAADAAVPADAPVVVTWNAVNQSLSGDPIDIGAYQVIVRRDLALASGEGFSQPVLDIIVPASVTSVAIPDEYLRPGTPYRIEVRAVADSGNQTISARSFETTGTAIDDLTEVAPPGAMELAASRYLIEHNAASDTTGYELYLAGAPWNRAWAQNPSSADIVQVRARGDLATLGMTEMFFETNQPPANRLGLPAVLALFPEGAYEMFAITVEGMNTLMGTATLSHTIPAAADITQPASGTEVPTAEPLEVTWERVIDSIEGDAADIVAYRVIVTKADADTDPSVAPLAPTFDVIVPQDTTSMTIPASFLEEGTQYQLEVVAIESTGNQTIAVQPFDTAADSAGQ